VKPLRFITFPKGENIRLSTHFKTKEFDCHCTRKECKVTIVSMLLIDWLEDLRARVGSPIVISSGFRCGPHQAHLRGSGLLQTAKGPSTHESGAAADIRVAGFTGAHIEPLARLVGFRAVGSAMWGVHVDLRLDRDRAWKYD
jgi:uncharacterized protein YcbK (DUF882 family)